MRFHFSSMSVVRGAAVLGILCGLAAEMFAQSPAPRTYGSSSGFGSVLFPGTGSAPPLGPGLYSNGTFGQRLGGIVSGFPPYTGAPGPADPGAPGRQQTLIVPFGVPVYFGGYAAPATPNVTIVNQQAPAAPAASPVVINQYFSPDVNRPVVREFAENELPDPVESPRSGMKTYRAPGPPAAEPAPAPKKLASEDKPTIYLIAFRDSSVQMALSYWLEGDTLHYISKGGTINRATLELIDREATDQLNRERSVEFSLARK